MLPVTLRPLTDTDISLVKRWLYTPHVAEWYKHPAHWLHELENRRGEFAFLSHFIAECEGTPIGFCQYYDCFFAQLHEVWNEEWLVCEGQGRVFSIDYLIGEAACLHKGHGREMVRQLTEMVRHLGAQRVIVEPEKENIASVRALLANGYILMGEDYVKELALPG